MGARSDQKRLGRGTKLWRKGPAPRRELDSHAFCVVPTSTIILKMFGQDEPAPAAVSDAGKADADALARIERSLAQVTSALLNLEAKQKEQSSRLDELLAGACTRGNAHGHEGHSRQTPEHHACAILNAQMLEQNGGVSSLPPKGSVLAGPPSSSASFNCASYRRPSVRVGSFNLCARACPSASQRLLAISPAPACHLCPRSAVPLHYFAHVATPMILLYDADRSPLASTAWQPLTWRSFTRRTRRPASPLPTPPAAAA